MVVKVLLLLSLVNTGLRLADHYMTVPSVRPIYVMAGLLQQSGISMMMLGSIHPRDKNINIYLSFFNLFGNLC